MKRMAMAILILVVALMTLTSCSLPTDLARNRISGGDDPVVPAPNPTSAPTNRPAPDPDPDPFWDDDCPTCSGLGECDECFGEGELWCTAYGCNGGSCLVCNGGYTYNYNGDEVRCRTCGGDDTCNKCGGSGYVDCRYCTGGKCSTCGGSGKRR